MISTNKNEQNGTEVTENPSEKQEGGDVLFPTRAFCVSSPQTHLKDAAMTIGRSHSLRPHGGAEALSYCTLGNSRSVLKERANHLFTVGVIIISLLINLFFESSLIM